MERKIQLFGPDQVLPEAVADFLSRNRDFHRPWLPEMEAAYYTRRYWDRALFQQQEAAVEGEGVFFYICEQFGAESVIGTISLTEILREPLGSCRLVYRMDKEKVNRGYMTEAVSLIAEYAFAGLGLHRIEAHVMPGNAPSLRVLQKCGFRAEGVSRGYLLVNGVWQDHVCLARLRDDP